MNIIKARFIGGTEVHRFKASQRRDSQKTTFHGEYWNSPAQLKARILRQRMELVGSRQS